MPAGRHVNVYKACDQGTDIPILLVLNYYGACNFSPVNEIPKQITFMCLKGLKHNHRGKKLKDHKP